MTERHHAQLTLTSIVLFGLAIESPEARMDPVLRRIDGLLDAKRGRKGTPAEVALRMLVLRKLRDWTFDRLEWEVTKNLAYRRFCRIDARKAPDAKTMIHIEQLLGGETLQRIFARITAMSIEKKVTTGRKMRVATTVVEAPIHYPTDSSLCADIVRVLRRAFQRVAVMAR